MTGGFIGFAARTGRNPAPRVAQPRGNIRGQVPQQALQENLQNRGSAIEEYQIAGIENCNELTGNFSFRQIFGVLVDCITSRNFNKFCMIMGVIECDWLKVDKNPEEYIDALSSLFESFSKGKRLNRKFFQ